MSETTAPTELHDIDRPTGPVAAAVLAAEVGIFFLGLLTTLSEASVGVHDFLDFYDKVGPLSGKTILAVAATLAPGRSSTHSGVARPGTATHPDRHRGAHRARARRDSLDGGRRQESCAASEDTFEREHPLIGRRERQALSWALLRPSRISPSPNSNSRAPSPSGAARCCSTCSARYG
jgi:hypothetical protein